MILERLLLETINRQQTVDVCPHHYPKYHEFLYFLAIYDPKFPPNIKMRGAETATLPKTPSDLYISRSVTIINNTTLDICV